MKLLLIWLLGVPLLVISMVLAQSLAAGQRVVKSQQVSVQQCSRQEDLHDMSSVVADQGHLIACQRQTIQ
jgi:hypothetical protein